MKLVVSYCLSDGCTYSCDMETPVEYDSEEKLLIDLEEAVKKFLATPYGNRQEVYGNWSPVLPNTKLYLENFIEERMFVAPTIRPLERWFEEEK